MGVKGVSPPVGEVARSAGGDSLAQHITASYKHDVVFCAKLMPDLVPLQVKGGALVAARRNLRMKCGNSAEERLNAKKR